MPTQLEKLTTDSPLEKRQGIYQGRNNAVPSSDLAKVLQKDVQKNKASKT